MATTFSPHPTERTGQEFAHHLVETGRIRIGHLVPIEHGDNKGKPTPAYLDHFRLTSNSRSALEMAQARYHGTLREWTVRPEWKRTVRPPHHRWELYTEVDVLDCIIHPGSLMHSTFERWQGGACILRCDGQVITKDTEGQRVGQPCLCPSDPQERKRLAKLKPPQGCDDCSRIAVILEGLKMGKWRVDTGGFYAPAETRGLQALLAECHLAGTLIPAQMRLEARTDVQRKDGKNLTHHYRCIVIEPRHAVEELMLAGAQHRFLLPPSIEAEGKSLPQHIADLYGDPAPRAADLAREWLPLIENAILAVPGWEVQPWLVWARDSLKKEQGDWTGEDWQGLLTRIQREAAKRMAESGAENAQEGGGKRQEGTITPQDVSADLPVAEASTGVGGDTPSPREGMSLFQQEEEAEKGT